MPDKCFRHATNAAFRAGAQRFFISTTCTCSHFHWIRFCYYCRHTCTLSFLFESITGHSYFFVNTLLLLVTARSRTRTCTKFESVRVIRLTQFSVSGFVWLLHKEGIVTTRATKMTCVHFKVEIATKKNSCSQCLTRGWRPHLASTGSFLGECPST